jgi:hypothetical protein
VAVHAADPVQRTFDSGNKHVVSTADNTVEGDLQVDPESQGIVKASIESCADRPTGMTGDMATARSGHDNERRGVESGRQLKCPQHVTHGGLISAAKTSGKSSGISHGADLETVSGQGILKLLLAKTDHLLPPNTDKANISVFEFLDLVRKFGW